MDYELLYINGKKCIATTIVHIDGDVLLKHNPESQTLSTNTVMVTKKHLRAILDVSNNATPLILKIAEKIDVDRHPIHAAYAYAAINGAIKTYGLNEKLILSDDIKIQSTENLLAEMVMQTQNRDFDIRCFSISLKLDKLTRDALTLSHVLIDSMKIITKPSGTPGEMDVYFCGLRLTKMTGISVLLFYDT